MRNLKISSLLVLFLLTLSSFLPAISSAATPSSLNTFVSGIDPNNVYLISQVGVDYAGCVVETYKANGVLFRTSDPINTITTANTGCGTSWGIISIPVQEFDMVAGGGIKLICAGNTVVSLSFGGSIAGFSNSNVNPSNGLPNVIVSTLTLSGGNVSTITYTATANPANTIPSQVCAVLPIGLSSFEVRGQNLYWQSAFETSFRGYGIEKSYNGTNFEKMGYVYSKGAGGYSFSIPADEASILYFRLRLEDKDGSYSYSPIISTSSSKSMFSISVAGSQVRISGASGDFSIVFTDLSGRVIAQYKNLISVDAPLGFSLATVINRYGKKETIKVFRP